MSFWSSATTRDRVTSAGILTGPLTVSQGALELRLGAEVAISDDDPKIIRLKEREEVKIPPGQTALLITEEIIKIPNDVFGLISLKTGVKSQGLINISGFHVDPGYVGRLKFWVYNAGKLPVIIKRGDLCFCVWFTNFDHPEKPDDLYKNKPGQDEVTAGDLNKMRGTIYSPAALAEKLKTVEFQLNIAKTVLVTLLTLGIGWFVKKSLDDIAGGPPPNPVYAPQIPQPQWTPAPPIKINV